MSSWHLEDTLVRNGIKTAMLTSNKGTVRHYDSECCVEFAPDPSREGPQEINLTFIDPALADFCYEADQWALKYLASHSLRLFKTPLTMMDIKLRYSPITDRTYPREPSMVATINLQTVAYFDQLGVTAPFDLDLLDVTPVLELKSMWFTDTGTCGLNLELIEVWV